MKTIGKKRDFSHASIWISPKASGKEALAGKELQTFLYSISGKKLDIHELVGGRTDGGPAIILGTVQSLSEIAGSFPEQVAQLKTGTDEAFNLHIGEQGSKPIALILANEPIGAIYGAYTFLEKFGIGFYFGGDALPGTDVPLQLSEMDEFWNPALPIRGCVPWFNFLNGPMTWDLEDYKYFFDQMVKMKANLVSFPEYGYGFTAYPSGGKLVPGIPLTTSATIMLGTGNNWSWGALRNMQTSEFGFGTGEFYTAPVYGSKATLEATDAQDAIRRTQELLAQAVAYARERGIKIGMGFELDGTPDETHLKDVESRLRVLVTKYPGVDYVWFWQGESACADAGYAEPNSLVPSPVEEPASHFAYLNNQNRAREGIRVASYVQKAYEVLKKIAPEKRVVISGWGGDKCCHFSDLFPGLDEVLPKDIIFSALENIDPSWDSGVSEFFGRVSADREQWPIPWWESDGDGGRYDQFMPQCNTKPFSMLLPDVLRKGCQGVLGVHWRVRSVEDVAAYTFAFAWSPTQTTYESFCHDFALRCFGEDDAQEMSELLMELDALGPRWTGGGGQEEANPFTWMLESVAPKDENLETLRRIRGKIQSIAERDLQRGKTQYLDRLERLINTIDWVTLYDEAALQIVEAQVKARKDRLAAAQMLLEAPLGEAMQVNTRLLYTQSDWGVLSTINVKAYAHFERHFWWCRRAFAGSHPPAPGIAYPVELPVQVAFKNPNKIVAQGEPVTVQVIVTGGDAVGSVQLYYRPLGDGEYIAMPMARGFRNVYQAVILGTAVTEKGLEYYIKVRSTEERVFRAPKYLPSIAVTVVKGESPPASVCGRS